MKTTSLSPSMPSFCLPSTMPMSACPTSGKASWKRSSNPVLPAEWIGKDTDFHINPTGRFEIGGPMGDCGLNRPQDNRRYVRRLCAPRLAAHSRARTRPRSIARRPTQPAMLRKTSSLPALPTVARSSCPMRSVWRNPHRSASARSAPARFPTKNSRC